MLTGINLSVICRKMTAAIRCLPILGRIAECSRDDHKHALQESLITILFATLPLWLLPLIGFFLFRYEIFMSIPIEPAELLIASAGLVGPFVYVISKNYRTQNEAFTRGGENSQLTIKFPCGLSILAASILTCMLSASAFALIKNPTNSPDFHNKIDLSGLWIFSAALFASSVLCFYATSAYKNMIENYSARTGQQQERDFAEAFSARIENIDGGSYE